MKNFNRLFIFFLIGLFVGSGAGTALGAGKFPEKPITLIVQVNGRVRDRIEVPAGIDNAEAERLALASDAVQRHVGDKQVVKVIVVPGRLVNVVAK